MNLAITSGNDGTLVQNANAGGGNSSYQMVGFDAHGAGRTDRQYHSFNFFARNNPTSSQVFSSSNRRWLAVVDGSTKEILYNKVLPNSFAPLPVAEVAEIRAAVNMAELPQEMENFASWAELQIPEADQRGEGDDPDLDGMTNLFEYAYGTNPSVADSEKGPRLVSLGNLRQLHYQRSMMARVSPLSLIGGVSPDSESPFDPDGLEEVGDPVDGVETVVVTLPENLGARFFLRLTTSAL